MARVVVDFHQLPRATRERLVDGTGPNPQLPPIFAVFSGNPADAMVGWLLAGLVALTCLLGLVTLGFGQPLYPDGFIQGVGKLYLYVILFFWLAAAGLGYAFERQRRKSLPFRSGRYLFPLDFISARSRQLVIRPLSDLIDLKAVHHHDEGRYTHTSFTFIFGEGENEVFTVRSQREAEERMRELQRIRSEFGRALERQDVDAVRRYDLFFDVRANGGFEALRGGLPAERLPWLIEKRWVAAFVVAVVLGSGTWFIRNLLSDHFTFASAKAQGKELLFRQYLKTGKLHVDEAKVLGAQHAFTECEQRETAQCWLDFLRNWKESPRLQEVREQRLPPAALIQASSSVSALRQFRKHYPKAGLDADAQERIHQLFAKALTDFKQEASTNNPELVPFVGKLLAHLEATENPTVLMRFRRQESKSLEMADTLLVKAGGSTGRQVAMASSYFTDAHTQPLEDPIAKELGAAFKQIFPSDLLKLEKGAPLLQEKGAGQSVPALDIVYTVGWSGESYGSEKDGRLFVGIEFKFDVSMSVPGEKPLNFSFTVKPPDRFSVEYTQDSRLKDLPEVDGGPSYEAVYRIMALRAFDELQDKLSQVFFRPGSKAYKVRGKPAFQLPYNAYDTRP
jgi:hypothetical protein